MTATETPVRCALADIADHRFVTVDARITAVDLWHQDTIRPWATITLTGDGELVDVQVYPLTFAIACEYLRVGDRVTVSGEVGNDADGLFMSAHTIHPIGCAR